MSTGEEFIRNTVVPPAIRERLNDFDLSNLFNRREILPCPGYCNRDCRNLFVGIKSVMVGEDEYEIIVCVSGTFKNPKFWTHPDRKNGFYNLCVKCVRHECTDIHLPRTIIRRSPERVVSAPLPIGGFPNHWTKPREEITKLCSGDNKGVDVKSVTKLCLEIKELKSNMELDKIKLLKVDILDLTRQLEVKQKDLDELNGPLKQLEDKLDKLVGNNEQLKEIVNAVDEY